jgi:zinc protease
LPGAATSAVPEANSAVTRETLGNGLRVIIVRDPLAPVVSVYENYLVGGNETTADFPGTAHAQEHMAFRGCSGVSGDQTAAIFADLGGDGDADTQQDVTQYYETVPADDLEVALHIDADCMRGIDDADSEWKSERGAIEQEVANDLSSPNYLAFTRLSADLFKGTPYAHDPLGTRESFDKTTGAMLAQFARQWYAPNNAVLVIAGDVDPSATLATVKRLYGSIPARTLPPRPAVDLQPVASESFTLPSDLPYVVFFQGFRFPGFDDPDYAAGRVLADVLGSERGEIYALGPQGKALQTGFQLVSEFPKASEAEAYGVLPAGSDAKALERTIDALLAAAAANGVPGELVEAAKRSEIAGNEFGRNSIPDLAAAWSEAVADEGRSSPDDDIAAIRNVTLDDVDRVARKVLDSSASVTAVLVPRPSGKAVPSKGYGGGETLTSAPTKAVALPSWAAAKLAQITVPNSMLAPVDMTLPNGLRLIVVPQNASDTVTVVGSVRHNDNIQTPEGKDGAGNVLEDLFPFGTQTLDRIEYQKALDDIGATVSAGSDFSLHVLEANFDRGVQLLADDELHPSLSAADFEIVRKQDAEAVAGEHGSPAYFVQQALRSALLPPNDPALREPTPESISRLTLADVQAYRTAVFRPDMTTVVVIGNVTADQAQATIAKYFGDWSASGPKPTIELPPIPQNKPSSTVVPDRSRVADATVLAETVTLTRGDPDYYAFELGDHVLGGGFYASRLYHDLRQVAGLVYNVSNELSAGKTRSTYTVSFGSDPPNVSKARRLIARDLADMRSVNVTPAELQQAKAILLRQLPLAESSEDTVASGLLGLSNAGLPLDEGHRGATIYAKLTPYAVRAAFAKYVRPNGFVQVVEGPPPG